MMIYCIFHNFANISNFVLKNSVTKPNIFKIKLIKTDAFGNLVWQKLYPEINNTTDSYKGNGFTIDPAGGYVIVGEDIKSQKSNLKIIG